MKSAIRITGALLLAALPFVVVPWHDSRVDAQSPAVRNHSSPSAIPSADRKATYVGKDVCKECHTENHKLHSVHGHAHTFRMANEPEVIEKFSGRTYETPEGYGTYRYDIVDGQLVAKIPEKFGDKPFALQFALGSGHHGMTLFSLVPDPKSGTVGIEHRASWYRNGDVLGATPGQLHTQPETPSELFGQKHVGEVMRKCVDCHVTTGEIKDQTVVNLTPSVNCEKCHGAGSVHVAQARAMQNPPPYSVGKNDWDAEAEIQLCGDCHRMPAAISRKELREYPAPLTRFQPIGMLRSECYLESNETMKCTTCHSPHTTVTAFDTDFYLRKCIECHDPNQTEHTLCSVSQSAGCIECHMPATEIDNYGTKFHDHWIRVHPDK